MGSSPLPRRVGRYVMLGEIAAGGMASVFVGKMRGDAGFQRDVAIKQLHERFAKDPDFVAMMLDEAHILSRVKSPNVVQVLDLVAENGEFYLVLELVRGEALSSLLRLAHQLDTKPTVGIAITIACDALRGLQAAHAATDEHGAPLGIVHRDVSPHNLMVGVDGSTRVLDFGVAKALGRATSTTSGHIKGKLSYMPPEQVLATQVDARSDVYALSVVLWEMLAMRRLLTATTQQELYQLASRGLTSEQLRIDGLDDRLAAILARGMQREPASRFDNAAQMLVALESLGLAARPEEVGTWVQTLARERLQSVSAILSRGETLAPPTNAADATGSAIRVDNPQRTSPAKTRSRTAWLVGAFAVVALGAFGAWVSMSRQAAPSESEAPAPFGATPDTHSSPASAPAIDTAPPALDAPPEAVEKPALTGTSTARGKPPAPTRVTPKPAKGARVIAHPKARSTPTLGDECTPPYELDAEGNRVYKRQCLKE